MSRSAGALSGWRRRAGSSIGSILPGSRSGQSIPTDSNPSSVAVGAGGIWAADRAPTPSSRRSVDTSRNPTPVGNAPSASPSGRVRSGWQTSTTSVVRIDPASNSVTTSIPVGRGPAGIAVGLGSVWVANSVDGTVSRIDPRPTRSCIRSRSAAARRRSRSAAARFGCPCKRAVDPSKQAGRVAHAADRADDVDSSTRRSPDSDSWEIEYATCAKLFNYPDKPRPAGTARAGGRAAIPAPTAGGKTYTFTIRRGFRFSPPSNRQSPPRRSGTRSSGRSARRWIPRRQVPFITTSSATRPTGRQGEAHLRSQRDGNTADDPPHPPRRRPADSARLPVLLRRPDRHADRREGVQTVPSAGPYYVASFTPGQGVVLKRNPNYHGPRPHRSNEIDYTPTSRRSEAVARSRPARTTPIPASLPTRTGDSRPATAPTAPPAAPAATVLHRPRTSSSTSP